MPRRPPLPARRPAAGQSLLDALVALLLVATTLLGAATAVVASIGASRAATLETIAVDLAADLAEELQSGAPAGDIGQQVDTWLRRAGPLLPEGSASFAAGDSAPDAAPQWQNISVGWRDHAAGQPMVLQLPLVAPVTAGGT